MIRDLFTRSLAERSRIISQSQEQTKDYLDRVAWVDTARGIAIALVVLGHCWRGLYRAGLVPDQAVFERLDAFIYAFHMPAFFILAGLFFHRTLSRSFAENLRRNVFRLLYPLVIWTYVFTGLMFLASGATNSQIGLSEVLSPPLPPKLHFWFLWAMFCIVTVFQLVHRLAPQDAKNADWFWAGLLGLALLNAFFFPYHPNIHDWTFETFQNAPFFVLGVLLNRWSYRPASGLLPALGAVAAFSLAAFALPLLPQDLWVGKLIALILCLALFVLAQAATRDSRWSRGLAYVGRNSLAIYLCHTIFGAPVRIALTSVGLRDIPTHLVLGVGVGIIGSLVVITLSRRLGISQVLGLGR